MERHFTLISTLLFLLLGVSISNASITSSTGSEPPFSPLLRSSSSSSWSQQQQQRADLLHQSHTILPSGTRCQCNTSPPNSNAINIHPCVITNVNIREGSGLILYEVSYLNNNELLVSDTLPFTRVQKRRNLRWWERVRCAPRLFEHERATLKNRVCKLRIYGIVYHIVEQALWFLKKWPRASYLHSNNINEWYLWRGIALAV